MRQKIFLSMLLFLSIVAPFAAFADSFKITPVDLEIGKTETLEFVLDSSSPEYLGFQATVELPAGIAPVKSGEGLDMEVTNAEENGVLNVASSFADGTLKIVAFSANHQPIVVPDGGVIVKLKVSVGDDFAGGTAKVKDIIFTNKEDKDVKDVTTDDATLGVKLTGLILNNSTLNLKVDKSAELTASLVPSIANASLFDIEWSSDNQEVATVATVDGKVMVTAKAYGKGDATITAKLGNVSADCVVTVDATPVDSIIISPEKLDIKVEGTGKVTATIYPATATDQTVTWSSSDTKIATVDNEGNVKGVGVGTATITATSNSIAEVTKSITVNVATNVIAVETITIDKSELTLYLNKGEKDATIVATITPDNPTDPSISWTSSNSKVASVDANGKVTAVGNGTTTIKATTTNGLFKECAVTVKTVVETVTLADVTIALGSEPLKLTATIAPADASDKTITWESDNESVASVDADGKVTAKAVGAAKITATADGVPATCTITVNNPVTAITLDPTEKELVKNETLELKATVTPEGATDAAITWSSSDEKVATVANGVVTAVGGGTATITASTINGVKATCKVTVTVPVAEITLDKTEAIVVEDETVTLTATVAPEDATDKTVTWTTSDASVATVKDGVVTAVKAGTATITVTSVADAKITATCAVTVTAKTIAVTGVTLAPATLDMTEGDTATLTATIAPEGATDKTVTWTTSDETVATVKDGVVTAVKAGTATITVTSVADAKITATCTVTVKAKIIAATSVTLDDTLTLTAGETGKLNATVAPSDATDKSVTWTTSDASVATVENGVVTAVAAGTAIITAATSNGISASCTVTVIAPAPENEKSNVPVKMTYVNMDDPDKAYGEIAEGESAEAGYNKISGGSVAFANEGWKVNYITYLQVNVSEIQGTILSATLTFDASGATDSKRTTGWGAGYNSSVWSSDMTYNTADKTITTVGEQAWTTSKSATTFDNLSIDITEAVNNADADGMVTILIYETAAAGGCIKNPVVTVEWSKEPTYQVTFKETNGAEAAVVVKKRDVTNGTSLINGTYSFSATAKGYKDFTGSFTVDGADKEVEFTMTPKKVWNWTTVSNRNTEISTGTCFEGEPATSAYPRYIFDEKNGTVWMKAPCGGDKKLEYNYTFTPTTDNHEEILEYSEHATNGIFFIEAEELDGMTATIGNNANIRCSNSIGAYPTKEGPVAVKKLAPGKYKVEIAFMGGKNGDTDPTFTVKAGETTVLSGTTNGSWTNPVSEEFEIKEETTITVEGGNASKPLDYILITGSVKVPVTKVSISGAPESHLYKGSDVQLTATVSPTTATNKTVTWTSSDESVATVDATGKVTALHVGKVTITATADEKSASCTIKCYPNVGDADWSGKHTTNDAVEISNYVVGKSAAPADWKEDVHGAWKEYYEHAANVNGTGEVTFADASAAVMLALEQPMAEDPEQARISAYSSNATDALVVGRLSATADGSISVPLTLDNSMAYVALQADIILPEGVNVEVKAGSRAAGHTLMTKKFGENRIRVSLFDLGNSAFADSNAPILEIVADSKLASAEEIAISSIYASDSNAKEYTLSSRVDVSTEVEGIQLDGNASVKVYDMNGRYISDKVEGLAKGIYIIRQGDNAKKVNIK